MKMITRVNKRRVGLVLFLAMLSWLGSAAVPVCAKENISIGSAGDPGDGWGIASGGSTDFPTDGSNATQPSGASAKSSIVHELGIVLLPYFDSSGLHFRLIKVDSARAGVLK
jgi:hypothetical protein